jgi:hypothetical protein
MKKHELIFKNDPKLPQTFYPLAKPVVINKGDIVGYNCVFSNRLRRKFTNLVILTQISSY